MVSGSFRLIPLRILWLSKRDQSLILASCAALRALSSQIVLNLFAWWYLSRHDLNTLGKFEQHYGKWTIQETGDTVSNGNLDIERSHGGEENNGRDGSKFFCCRYKVDYMLVGPLSSSALEIVDQLDFCVKMKGFLSNVIVTQADGTLRIFCARKVFKCLL